MKSPCIKNKCILYPVCINKKHVECNQLLKYHDYMYSNKQSRFNYVWKEIYKVLPKIESISGENNE